MIISKIDKPVFITPIILVVFLCFKLAISLINLLLDLSSESSIYTLSILAGDFPVKPKVVPVKIYSNPVTQKRVIVEENKRSGIYRWVNNINGKTYVGSSRKLNTRFSAYFRTSFLLHRLRGSLIYKALLKHGHSNFTLEILEYCEPEIVIQREQFYLDNLEPEYNLCKTAGSSFGLKTSLETRAKMSAIAKNRTYSHKPSFKVEVEDLLNNTKTVYKSMREAARSLDSHMSSLLRWEKNSLHNEESKKPFKGRYNIVIMRS